VWRRALAFAPTETCGHGGVAGFSCAGEGFMGKKANEEDEGGEEEEMRVRSHGAKGA
jgi:hypothetical protein